MEYAKTQLKKCEQDYSTVIQSGMHYFVFGGMKIKKIECCMTIEKVL